LNQDDYVGALIGEGFDEYILMSMVMKNEAEGLVMMLLTTITTVTKFNITKL